MDAKDFAGQHPAFLSNPVRELGQAMLFAANDESIADMYVRFVKVMVFDVNPPAFAQAISKFNQTLNSVMPQPGLNFMQYHKPSPPRTKPPGR